MHTKFSSLLCAAAAAVVLLGGIPASGATPVQPTAERPSAERQSPNAYATDGLRSPGVSAMACAYVPSTANVNVTRAAYTIAYESRVSAKLLLAMFEAGWIESHWNNLTCGDRDSVGIFQFRPSMGWGTYAECTDVTYQVNKWISVARGKEPYAATSGALAQAVEVSANPGAYDQAESKARALMTQAIAPVGAIATAWNALGANNSAVGAPLAPASTTAVPGLVQDFAHGIILWHNGFPAHSVRGAILARFTATGGVSKWGFPQVEESPGQVSPAGTRGAGQKFEKATVLWSSVTGTHVVHGVIGAKFAQAGGERVLGYPQTEEMRDSSGGIYQNYQNAMIRWTSTTGAVILPRVGAGRQAYFSVTLSPRRR